MVSFKDAVNSVSDFLDKSDPLGQNQNPNDGFTLPDGFSADGNNLPTTRVPIKRNASFKRNIIHWFIPEFGVVKMYINPSSIQYSHKKLITKERTKGGFTLQYWGEDLSTLAIAGTTGSSGVEGINLLTEMYRAEQLAFDGFGLTIAASNSNNNPIANAVGSGINSLLGSSEGSITNTLLGIDTNNGNMIPKNIISLAQSAFTVEMYYNGWVFRGFFENMTVNERADNFLWDYTINFTVTQRRGYRGNYFGWHRSPKGGPSQYNTPYSFSGKVK